MDLKAYIAGPMTGLPGYNFDAFNEAEKQLRGEGYEVNNPAEHFGGNTDLPRSTYMKEAYKAVLKSDVVFVLPGWRESLGATDEVLIALHSGIQVLEFRGRQPVTGLGCVLLEAREIVLSQRAKTYGHPLVNWGKTAELWQAFTGKHVRPENAALMMVLMKLARHMTGTYHRDNLIDACGYVKAAEMILSYGGRGE